MHIANDLQAAKGSSDREGGLSKALKTGARQRSSHEPHQESNATSAPGQKQDSSNAEPSLLGRSPSRNFVSANHLLNFQFDRSKVSLAAVASSALMLVPYP